MSCPGCNRPYEGEGWDRKTDAGCTPGYAFTGETPVQPYCKVLGKWV